MTKSKIMPPTYFLIALMAVPTLHFLLPVVKIIPFPWNGFGIVLIVVGIVFDLAGDRLFHLAGTTVKPYEELQALVTTGVFRVTRNPMYLGFALILVGAAGLFGTLGPFLAIAAFGVAIDRLFIRTEEEMLTQKFGQAYLDYRKKVRRWI